MSQLTPHGKKNVISVQSLVNYGTMRLPKHPFIVPSSVPQPQDKLTVSLAVIENLTTVKRIECHFHI